MRPATLVLAAACLAPAARAQQAAPFATPERDAASVAIAQVHYVVSRLAGECLAVVGRAESPQSFTANWEKRNARYVRASSRYLDRRVEAAGGPDQRDGLRAAVRKAVQEQAEAQVASLLQGRRETGCMDGITLVDAGALDIGSKLPQFEQLEALARWAEQ